MFADPVDALTRKIAKDDARECFESEEELETTWRALMSALEIWKLQHGNRKPVDGTVLGGLLSGNPKRISFSRAKPWQCTGYVFETATSLTQRLLVEPFPEVDALAKSVTVKKLMAALLIKSKDEKLWDWFSAYRLMLYSQIPEARTAGSYAMLLEHWDAIKSAEQQRTILAAGRLKGVETRKANAEKNQGDLITAIKDLFDKPDKPGWGWTNNDIVKYLKKTKVPYSETTILQAVKSEAARFRKQRKIEQASKYLNR